MCTYNHEYVATVCICIFQSAVSYEQLEADLKQSSILIKGHEEKIQALQQEKVCKYKHMATNLVEHVTMLSIYMNVLYQDAVNYEQLQRDILQSDESLIAYQEASGYSNI